MLSLIVSRNSHVTRVQQQQPPRRVSQNMRTIDVVSWPGILPETGNCIKSEDRICDIISEQILILACDTGIRSQSQGLNEIFPIS